jgi:hypothetical protein
MTGPTPAGDTKVRNVAHLCLEDTDLYQAPCLSTLVSTCSTSLPNVSLIREPITATLL